MLTPMEVPLTRTEFEERMAYSAEQIRLGKMHFGGDLRSPESLLKVRRLPNGRIDLLSIDESARLHANMSYQMRHMDLDDADTVDA